MITSEWTSLLTDRQERLLRLRHQVRLPSVPHLLDMERLGFQNLVHQSRLSGAKVTWSKEISIETAACVLPMIRIKDTLESSNSPTLLLMQVTSAAPAAGSGGTRTPTSGRVVQEIYICNDTSINTDLQVKVAVKANDQFVLASTRTPSSEEIVQEAYCCSFSRSSGIS